MDYISIVRNHVQNLFVDSESSHNWSHIQRVHDLAIYIQSKEGGNLEVIELAALLHDIADHKFNDNNFELGGQKAFLLVKQLTKNIKLSNQIKEIVDNVSYKGSLVPDKMLSIEGQIVRDADRLDAIGAIGIARAFSYGGHKGQNIFNSVKPPIIHNTKEEYASSKNHTIAHFYEKLLLLKNRMETNTGKQLAKDRHDFLIKYLNQFFSEINFKFESTDFDLRDYA